MVNFICHFTTTKKKVPDKQKGYVKKGRSVNLPKVVFKYVRSNYIKTFLEGGIEVQEPGRPPVDSCYRDSSRAF